MGSKLYRNNYPDIGKVKEEMKLERKSKVHICFVRCFISYAKIWSFHFVTKTEQGGEKYVKMLKARVSCTEP